MQSKNKAKKTDFEKFWLRLICSQPCAVCGDQPIEIHEPEQGLWFISIPLCYECHRGKEGWHGNRLRWKMRKIDELGIINQVIRKAVFE